MFGWKKFDGFVKGVLVEGDRTAPRTRWWNHWYLLIRGWRLTAVMAVDKAAADDGFRIGFVPEGGAPCVKTRLVRDSIFRMLVGREDCIFFALDRAGNEVPLTHVCYGMRKDLRQFGDAPLY